MSSTTGIQLSCTLKVARLYEFNTEIYHTGKNWETLTWRAYDTQAALSFGATLNSLNFTTAAETGQTHRYGEATGRPRWHREERGNIQFKSHSWTANRKIITLSSREWRECDRTSWRRRPESINHQHSLITNLTTACPQLELFTPCVPGCLFWHRKKMISKFQQMTETIRLERKDRGNLDHG